MDVNTITVFLSKNSETIKKFVKLMFEDCKIKIQELRKEIIELCRKIKSSKIALSFVITKQITSRDVSKSFRVHFAPRMMLIQATD